MPRNTNTAIQNNFIGGLITQATALNFPDNACIEQNNCIFSERGIVSRRLGMEFENNSITKTSDRTEKAQTCYLWKNVAGDGNINLVVQQNGGSLFFYSTTGANSLSGGISANSITLSSFQSAGSTTTNLDQNECQFSSGLGYLFVVHPYCDPFYVLYNSDGTFTSSLIPFTIRDVTGIHETGNVDTRPASLTDNHKYNLLNQGWDTTKIATMHTALSTTYPSNADVWQLFKDSTEVFSPSTTLPSRSRGSTPAPQGYFRLNPWSTSRAAIALAQAASTLSLVGTVDETSGTVRPAVTEFHAGRVFYAGVNAQGYNSRIYFSKIVESVNDFGVCMSENDPTSETLFDFLSSDGGIIAIPQAGTIYKLISLGSTLVVFGANGIWTITGSVGLGFSATDYTVTPISYTRSISGSSFVLVDGTVIWWNLTGINVLSQTKDGLAVQSLTDKTIKDFYLDIGNESKRFARGTYNQRTHTVQWLYRTAAFASLTETYTFDTCLNFNTLTNAFYTWSFPANVGVNGLLTLEGVGSLTGSDNVVDNSAVQVVDNLGNDIVTFGFSRTSITTVTKFLVSYVNGGSFNFTFAEELNNNYLDWVQNTVTGVDYTSYFITGYQVKTQGERRFQSNYIFVFNDLSDLSSGNNSYVFQTLWNYGNINTSGEWTQRQTISQSIAHTETQYDAARRRLKVRGSGTSVQFKFSSVTGTPFNIIGWSTFDTANQHV